MDWFGAVGDQMVDRGNPMSDGVEVTPDEVVPLVAGRDSLTGYSIVNVDSLDAAIDLAKTNPMITSVVVYELARM